MKNEKETRLTEEYLTGKAVKNIKLVVIIGILLIAADLISTMTGNGIELLEGDGGIYMMRPSSGSDATSGTLKAEIDEQGYSKSFDLSLDCVDEGQITSDDSAENTDDKDDAMSKEELAAYEIRSTIKSINSDTTRRRVYLPEKLTTGERIHWSVKRRTNTFFFLLATITLSLILFNTRLTPLRRKVEEEQDSIARQLPEFINRLVLLLNAGLVLNSAFEKAIEEGCGEEGDYFFGQMQEIHRRVQQANGSMHQEFRDFARSRRKAGGETSRELMRISNIISDNISKGAGLTEKLQRESEILWASRRRSCEERGRVAETKLTLPLTLFLLVLIVITISPALLEL